MIDVIKPLIKQFLPFAQERMGFDRPPSLFLKQDAQNASNPLGKTAFYDPAQESITIFISQRHPKDVMRSLSHELVHHTQNCNGELDNPGEMGEGYAQNNDHMRGMERQAYEMGNMCFRDWEDSIKGTIYNESLQKGVNKRMSTKKWKDNELRTLVTEQWGFKFDLDALNERRTGSGVDHTVSDPETMEKAGEQETRGTATSKRGLPSAKGSVAHPKAGRIDRTDIANKAPAEWLKEGEENELFEQATTICKQRHDLLGDKAVRECIEEEMTRMVTEGCPHEEEEEELEERHKPDNIRQGREPGRRRKNVNTGQKTLDEEKIRQVVRSALQNYMKTKR
tara:strand:+ start:2007 stop:3020 length:1014 start_codon:yes stop_codon:yes gene_type:complete